jgi:hypothetical protein
VDKNQVNLFLKNQRQNELVKIPKVAKPVIALFFAQGLNFGILRQIVTPFKQTKNISKLCLLNDFFQPIVKLGQ